MFNVSPSPDLLAVDCLGVAWPDECREGEGGWVEGRETMGVLLNHSFTLSEDAALFFERIDDRRRGELGIDDEDRLVLSVRRLLCAIRCLLHIRHSGKACRYRRTRLNTR